MKRGERGEDVEGGVYGSKREIEGERDRGREGDGNRQGRTGHGGHAAAALSVLMRNNARNCCFEPVIRSAPSVCVACANDIRTCVCIIIRTLVSRRLRRCITTKKSSLFEKEPGYFEPGFEPVANQLCESNPFIRNRP